MDHVAGALADPIRRQILQMLREAPRTAGSIAAAFRISRPAVSRHLRVLREAGLVLDSTQGRERVYQLEVAPLAELEAFMAELKLSRTAVWERRFMALETEVHRVKRASSKRAAAGHDVNHLTRDQEKTG